MPRPSDYDLKRESSCRNCNFSTNLNKRLVCIIGEDVVRLYTCGPTEVGDLLAKQDKYAIANQVHPNGLCTKWERERST